MQRLSEKALRREISSLLEKRVREADVSGGERVEFGSDKHVADLKRRLDDAVFWRDKQRKGSEARANYQRLVMRLRAELNSASRIASSRALKVESSRSGVFEEFPEEREWIDAAEEHGYTAACARCGVEYERHKTFCADGGAPDYRYVIPERPDLGGRRSLPPRLR